MATLGCLLSFVVLVQLSHVAFSCAPQSSQKCSWTTCRHEWRNDWRPHHPPQGGCVMQSRHAHHIYSTHQRSGSDCPGSQQCTSQTQRRRLCSCRNAYYCPMSTWTQWTGNVPSGTCRRQSRSRSYNEAVRYIIRQSSCNGIKPSCGNRQFAYRIFCSCRYAQCSLGSWSSWTDLPKPVSKDHCASQQRQRNYTLSWAYKSRGNCTGIQPQQCPGPQEETREKESC